MNISIELLRKSLLRARADENGRLFVRHPYESHLIDVDSEAWVNDLHAALEQGRYEPGPMDICDAPKSPVMVRPGGLLNFTDRVVFAACVGLCLSSVRYALEEPPEVFDLSNQLSSNPSKVAWLKSRFECWKSFREESLKALSADITCVVVADISGFYENIDIPLLISELRAAGAPADAVTQLNACLRKWNHVGGSSVPQGHSAGDILAKLYLHPVDAILGFDYQHLRFVDDFRIFCRTRAEAIKALTDLNKLLRDRGLVLNSSKSQILLADEARQMIEGAIPIIEQVREGVVRKITDLLGSHYVSPAEFKSILESSEDEIPLELIEHTFEAYFIDQPNLPFQRSLFHFLLNRLNFRKSTFALQYCLETLSKHPEETQEILQYLSSIAKNETANDDYDDIDAALGERPLDKINFQLADFLESKDNVFPYQTYQIMDWIGRSLFPPGERLLNFARHTAFDRAQPPFLRAVAIRVLGDFGNTTDLTRLEAIYRSTSNDLERCEIVCALKRMETGRRNEFFGRVQNESELVRRADRWAKQG